ncbi:helix-turn-helix domain-containing protein [Candidatus Woesearchaeota archaeon]|nr:helix-turn-helix domain-containing protein [Candidatus Woesearchaeota archaeon]
MAKKENFVLVSLKEDKARELAQAISNPSCRKILDHLAEKEATESELAKSLNIPISTVHYNLQHLTQSGLVAVEEFHYSEKGKEVNHYKLANKYVIIAPKTVTGIKTKLKNILPIALITVAAAGMIHIFSKSFFRAQQFAAPAVRTLSQETVPTAEKAANVLENTTLGSAPSVAGQSIISQIPAAAWFLIGAVFAMTAYFIYLKILHYKK